MQTSLDTEIKSNNNVEINKDKINNKKYLYEILKRILDIISSLLGLIVAIPIILVIAIIIKLEDNGPVFYSQQRLGKDEKNFFVYKLRSMRVDAEKYGGAQWAQKDDPRITKIGKFIRKTRIDEIPQLFNILKGDMSLIGPRPERPELTYKFNKEIPGFIDRLVIKPGLTGLAQVNGGYDISPEEKLKWDIIYIKNRNIFLDISIVFKTIGVVFTGDGAR
ncbi:glycosyltransferase [[Clostridium] sordellii]|uniref:exopolysaccharide biosynthesis polyprenyl glycosylphosphotransferase n=1 Tax=Paraclostridium sordellii TaxID=1505 RepID=UPI0005E75E78|nr:exopolysaccharide biosynthesis polyprenyl glycosylphosphotransferase [Paeniclostridium sordellii]MCH1967469.1 exopolysaccharide biosynthesis polyprenyl glycosylphosphotransferase [Paeniclostridium sordellii]MCQ4697602.1 exopolysaccharide biosynthesis polyprenyl glycosylphosphotransferase [Paeniclostridium sordellii]MDU2147819.1 exopolysaccharide biosynthesis polyprenyl glycosylphosphotransferase [Paeniclostridium sordellii]MDU4413412.1 exopolysaccharide biosynthesis polyprenyl glycosylphosph